MTKRALVLALMVASGGWSANAAGLLAETRERAIQRTIQEIERECQVQAGGDWNRWFAQLAPFRLALRKQIEAVKPYNPNAKGTVEARAAVLEAAGNPPLFEPRPDDYLRYLYSVGDDLSHYVATRPALPAIEAVSVWLKKQGIDLIVVPVPKMTEVYPDRVVPETPPSRIVAPQNRKFLLELLKANVEVVDLLPLFLDARRDGAEPLYRPADPHWSQRGMLIAAKEIGRRLKRYGFVRQAVAAPSAYKVAQVDRYLPGAAYPALSPEQRQSIEGALTTRLLEVTPATKPVFSDDAPVMFIGDSFTRGLMDLVAREINMPVRQHWGAGQTTAAIKDFVRDPTSLHNCRVVVWVNQATAYCWTEKWTIPPLQRAGGAGGTARAR
jgi:hypothetical protein